MADLNVKHFNKILRHIEEDLKRLNMGTWGVRLGTEAAKQSRMKKRDFAECGTACCFAGWSFLLSQPKRQWKSLFSEFGDLENEDTYETTVVFDSDSEAGRLGLNTLEAEKLFAPIWGNRKRQFKMLKERIRSIISQRVKCGDNSGEGILV